MEGQSELEIHSAIMMLEANIAILRQKMIPAEEEFQRRITWKAEIRESNLKKIEEGLAKAERYYQETRQKIEEHYAHQIEKAQKKKELQLGHMPSILASYEKQLEEKKQLLNQ